MSNEAINWVMKLPRERIPCSSAKFVLFVLANQCASDRAFASVAYVADATGQDRKTVLANIARLQEWNLISDTGERRGKTGQIPVYRLSMGPELFDAQAFPGNSPKNGTVPKTGPVPKTDGNSPVFSRQQSQKRDTEPKEPKEPNSLSPAVACAKAMIEAGMPKARVNPSHPDLLRAAAKCNPGELADVVREVIARNAELTALDGEIRGPPNLAYVCTAALNRRSQAAARDPAHGNATDQSRRPGPASGESPAQRASRKIRARYQAQDEAAAAATVSVD